MWWQATTAFLALAALLGVVLRAKERGLGYHHLDANSVRRSARFSLAAAAMTFSASLSPNNQTDAAQPVRTWRDYAHRSDFRALFRFRAADIPALITALQLPPTCVSRHYRFTSDVAISVLLYTLARDATLLDLNQMFGLKRTKASAVLRWTMATVYERWHKPLFVSNFRRWAPLFPRWADAVYQRQGRPGTGHTGIVGFVDGSFFMTCRPPGPLQRAFFSGHKWKHGVHFQGVLAPNGLLIDFCGPFEGRRTDKHMIRVSHLCDRFGACMDWASKQTWGSAAWLGQLYYLYGDAGYNRRAWLQTQFQCPAGGQLSVDQTACNYALSRTRVPNEWIYGRMSKLWPYIANAGHLHVGTGRRPPNVTHPLFAAAILTNALTCCDGGNATSEYFGLTAEVPPLDRYFCEAPPSDECPRAWYDHAEEYGI